LSEIPDSVPGRMLVREMYPHRFRGVSLASLVPGMATLAPEDTVLLHPHTAQELGVADGGSIPIGNRFYPVRPDRKVAPGTLYLMSS